MKDRTTTLEPRFLTQEELDNLPVENGIIKVIVLDGTNDKIRGHVVKCPSHGNVIAHIHNEKFDKLLVQAEYKTK